MLSPQARSVTSRTPVGLSDQRAPPMSTANRPSGEPTGYSTADCARVACRISVPSGAAIASEAFDRQITTAPTRVRAGAEADPRPDGTCTTTVITTPVSTATAAGTNSRRQRGRGAGSGSSAGNGAGSVISTPGPRSPTAPLHRAV